MLEHIKNRDLALCATELLVPKQSQFGYQIISNHIKAPSVLNPECL